MENPIQLTPRFTEAVDYARHVHVELRKGTQVPYMAHNGAFIGCRVNRAWRDRPHWSSQTRK